MKRKRNENGIEEKKAKEERKKSRKQKKRKENRKQTEGTYFRDESFCKSTETRT